MATSSTCSSACRAWLAAPVPLPPQPTSAIFNFFSLKTFIIALVLRDGRMSAPDTIEVFLMKSLRDLDLELFLLLFILCDFNLSIGLLSSIYNIHPFWVWYRASRP